MSATGGLSGQTDGLTPGRSLVVTFDAPDYAAAQSFWRDEAELQEIEGSQSQPQTKGWVLFSGIGYRLESITTSSYVIHETGAADASQFDDSNANVPSGFLQLPYKRWNNEFVGVPQGTQTASGDLFWQSQPSAGDDWSSSTYSNTADQAAHPGPVLESDVVPLDRVITAHANGEPDDCMALRVKFPGSGGGASNGTAVKIYFSGCGEFRNGIPHTNGEYCASFRMDGTAQLDGKLTSGSWTPLKQFRWAPAHHVTGAYHIIKILNDAYRDASGNWIESKITIQCETASDVLNVLLMNTVNAASNDFTTSYTLSQGPTYQPAAYQPARLDIRRDLRAKFQLCYDIYKTGGVLQTKTFNANTTFGPISSANPVCYLTIHGSFPSGTDITVQAVSINDTDGSETTISTTPVFATPSVLQFSFTPDAGASRYYFLITGTTDGSGTPTISLISPTRAGINALPAHAATPWELSYFKPSVTVTGPEADPSTESASISFADVTNLAGVLATRGGLNVRVETVQPDATTSTVFMGKLIRAKRYQQGSKPARAFSDRWPYITADCMGMARRLMQAKTLQKNNFGINAPDDATQPWRITDIITELLLEAGLSNSMIDVAASPLRLEQPTGQGSQGIYRIEPYTPILPLIIEYVETYLGAYLIFDPNATNGGGSSDKYGCWRVIYPKRPNSSGQFSPLIEIVRDAPWTDKIRSKANINSYPTATAPDGSTMQTVPILGATLVEDVVPPEFNALIVTGTVGSALFQAQSASSTLTQRLVNWPAAYFFDGQPIADDPTNPDWTDGSPNIAILVDSGLATQQAVNFTCRRMFDLGAHTQYWKTFVTPAVLITDSSDPLQVRARIPRTNDIVYMDGSYWVVHSCNFECDSKRGGSYNQRLVWEIFQNPALMGMSTSVYSNGQFVGSTGAQSY